MNPQIISFYCSQSAYTEPRNMKNILMTLPEDNANIIGFIKAIMIHPFDAKREGVNVNIRKALREQIEYSTVIDIFGNEKVKRIIADYVSGNRINSLPSDRIILSCDHHTILFASILRVQKKPVRVRCGYARYIVKGKLVPHWICEVYGDTNNQWIYVDPERNILKLEKSKFLLAGEVWRDVKKGEIELNDVIPDYRKGFDGIKYRVLNDLNAVMKNELINYDWLLKRNGIKPPRLFSLPTDKLTVEEKELLDKIANATIDIDNNWEKLKSLYFTFINAKNLRQKE